MGGRKTRGYRLPQRLLKNCHNQLQTVLISFKQEKECVDKTRIYSLV